MSFSTEMFLFPNIWNLQELAAKLEAMNETAMEKLTFLMETSEAFWLHFLFYDLIIQKIAKVDFLYDLSTCNVFFAWKENQWRYGVVTLFPGFPQT